MAQLGGKEIEVDSEGYLANPADWTEDVAKDLAKSLNIDLSDDHWKVINFLREQHDQGVEMSIRKVGKSGIVDLKKFYELFPGGPLKTASKIAGLSRPASCV